MTASVDTAETVRALGNEYKYGFVTEIDEDRPPKGLSEDIVRFISKKKNEPQVHGHGHGDHGQDAHAPAPHGEATKAGTKKGGH